MKTSLIKFSMVLACILLSTYSKAQVEAPSGGFTHDYDGISCPPVTVTFTNIEDTTAVDYFQWWFGNDGPYTVFDISYTFTFTQGGYYGIRMKQFNSAEDLMGEWWSDLYINGASLNISADTACPGDEIYFQLQTQDDIDPDRILWDFGDGNSAFGWDVYHVYDSIGTYEVTLITDVGCGIDTVTQSVYIGNAVAPVANINIWPNPSCPDDVINFEAWNSAGSFSWVFGDGNDTIVTDPHIEHSYSATSNYTVKMIVTNGCGLSDSTTNIVYVQNGLPFTDQVYFSVEPDTACPGDGILFDSWEVDNYAGFAWNFGDGSPIDTTNTELIHYYSASGTYPITLTVINGCGNPGVFLDTVVISNNVFPDPAQYDYGFIPAIACPNDSILFYSQKGAASYFWDFGDGNTGSEVTVLQGVNLVTTFHAYADTGTYAVAFTLTNACGLSFTDTFNVYISDSASYLQGGGYPAIYWDGEETDAHSATCEEIMFFALVGGSTFSWDWGDGDTTLTNTMYTTHRYKSPGTYTISLFVQNYCGDTATFTDNITIEGLCPLLTATVSGTDPTCKSLADGSATVTVSNGLSPYTYLWDDPAGQTTATATGLSEGTYTVIVTDAAGDNASATITLTASYELLISIDQIIDATCGDNDGVAIASATGGTSPYIYQWSNGVIGAVDTALSAGFYFVTVTDANGCSDFALATVSNNNGPVITVVSTTDADCNGSGGAIDIFISQGTPPYTYLWSNGGVTEDISNLTAGPYEVSVTDANGCVGLKSIIVAGQDAFTLTTTTTNANCESSDGSATVNISGGASPYTYLWPSGGTDATENNLAAGVYNVTVTDANGCVGSITAAVSNINSPSIAIDSITDPVCGGAGGSIFINVTGGTPAYDYLWSNASDNQDLINAIVGVYDIEVTDANGCIATASFEISMVPTAENPICLVTVDSVTQSNLIVWEKPAQQGGIESYNIYKESSQAGVYFLIGNRAYAGLSEFNDTLSDPRVRSWRYKLSVVDACGNESELSEPHKTMHLTQNLGLNNTVNLIWDHYEGFTFGTYDIYRYSSSLGWEKLDGIASDLTSYTDLAPPSSGFFYYVVEVLKDQACNSTRKAGTHNSSRSNRTVDLSTTGVKEVRGNINHLAIYPNPSRGIFNLTFELEEKEDVVIRIFDILGRFVLIERIDNFVGKYNEQLDLSAESPGIYHLQIISESGNLNKPIVIE